MRKSGILMHVSTLPGEYSCGSFGEEAKETVDLLAKAGFRIWQTLPFGWPDTNGSPYKSLSGFAGNPFFIDLETLFRKGLITKRELEDAKQRTPYLCEFERLFRERFALLKRASARIPPEERERIDLRIREIPELFDFCLYMAEKEADGEDALFFHEFLQHEFLDEWYRVKAYANAKGIEIIGDIPIYLDPEASDVKAHPEYFQLDPDSLRPTAVAGVPPDYFAEDGQLWGNPLYDWDRMKEDGYKWWKARIRHQLTLFDGIRIDHFRGFSAYWSVPAGAKSAKEGKWVKGPGREFVEELKKVAGEKLIIAEDLGDIDEDVVRLLADTGLPGMRVFQFAFLSDDNPHLPHYYPENVVAYSGTHDNNTLLGYIFDLDEETRQKMLDYIGFSGTDGKYACPYVIKTLMRSAAARVVFPVQDLLEYGMDTRMNTPGVADGNWAIRFTKEQLGKIDCGYWKKQNELYNR
ncbi:MAG: 4-alpha-glucanotransferase [Clostridia bacterium]|nr:4-alpha-glucanotransferase [Clostridia bacterium]